MFTFKKQSVFTFPTGFKGQIFSHDYVFFHKMSPVWPVGMRLVFHRHPDVVFVLTLWRWCPACVPSLRDVVRCVFMDRGFFLDVSPACRPPGTGHPAAASRGAFHAHCHLADEHRGPTLRGRPHQYVPRLRSCRPTSVSASHSQELQLFAQSLIWASRRPRIYSNNMFS